MNKSSLLFSIGMAAAALFAGESDARAELWMMPGQLCQPTSTTQSSKISYESALGIRNNASSALLVACPLVIPANPSGHLTEAVLFFEDKNTTQDVSCTLFITEENGSVTFSSTKTSSGSSPTGVGNLIWSGLPTTQDFNLIVFNCSVPAFQSGVGDGNSRVLAYYVNSTL